MAAITVDRADLLRATQLANQVVPRASLTTGIAHQALWLRALDGQLSAAASDGLLTIESTVGTREPSALAAAVPARLFSDIIREIDDDLLTLAMGAGGLRIRGGRFESELHEFPRAKLTPPPRETTARWTAKVPASAFAEGFRHVALSIAITDAWRPSLVGVSISLRPSSVGFVATDLYQVAEATLEAGSRIDRPGGVHEVLVADYALRFLARSMPPTGELTLRVGDRLVEFVTAAFTIRALLEPVRFPDCSAFTAACHERRLTFRRHSLARVLTRMKLLAEPNTDLWCEVSPGSALFRLRHRLLGEVAESCPVEYDGPSFVLGVRAASFFGAAKNLKGWRIDLETGSDPTKPVTMSTWERPHLRYHLLPLTTSQPPSRIHSWDPLRSADPSKPSREQPALTSLRLDGSGGRP